MNKNTLDDLKSKIPNFSGFNYPGVRYDMTANNEDFNRSFREKDKNIFVHNKMNIDFITKYTENSMRLDTEEKQLKMNDFSDIRTVNFMEVIQKRNDGDFKAQVHKYFIEAFINSKYFNIIIAGFIIINTVFICVQTNEKIYHKIPILFQVADAICVTVFTVELAIKFFNNPRIFFLNGWNIFDFVVVIFSYLSTTLTFVSSFRVLRIFRIFQSVHALTKESSTSNLYIFLALFRTARDVGSVLLLVAIFLLCSSFIAYNLFSSYSDYWFGSLTKTWWTLVLFITADGWLDPYYDLVDAGQRYFAMVFIFIYIWIGNWILINTLTGVSKNSIDAVKKEDEEEKKSSKANKMIDDEESVKKLTPPPSNADRSWEMQKPMEIPKVDHINPDALIHLYLTLSLINQNIAEMEELVEQYQLTYTEIMNQQEELSKNNQ